MPRKKPNRYETDIAEHLAEVEKLAETLNDLELAKVLGIGKTAFKRYKATYPEFREAIARGKAIRGGNYEKIIKPKLAEIAEMYQTMSENEIVSELGISKSSWSEYKATHEEMREALQRGKEKLCTRVKKALLEAAEGYEYTETEEIREDELAGKILVIRPPEPLNIGKTEKDPDELRRVYEIGRKEAEKRLEEIREFLK